MQAGSANRELLDLLVAFLPQRFPGHFQLDGTRLSKCSHWRHVGTLQMTAQILWMSQPSWFR